MTAFSARELRRLLAEAGKLAEASVVVRERATRRLATLLGGDWGAAKPRRGETCLPLLHRPTGLDFVAVPGGRFSMGLSEKDIAEASEHIDWTRPIASAVEALRARTRPVHVVLVAPFLCGRRPLASPAEAQRVGGDRTDCVRSGALQFVAHAGFRLLAEAEFEWLARGGTGRAFIGDAGRRYAAAEAGKRTSLRADFGVAQLDRRHWVRDGWHPTYRRAPSTSVAWTGGDPAGVVRSGFHFAAMQSPDELLGALAAARARGTGTAMVRLAADLPVSLRG